MTSDSEAPLAQLAGTSKLIPRAISRCYAVEFTLLQPVATLSVCRPPNRVPFFRPVRLALVALVAQGCCPTTARHAWRRRVVQPCWLVCRLGPFSCPLAVFLVFLRWVQQSMYDADELNTDKLRDTWYSISTYTPAFAAYSQ